MAKPGVMDEYMTDMGAKGAKAPPPSGMADMRDDEEITEEDPFAEFADAAGIPEERRAEARAALASFILEIQGE